MTNSTVSGNIANVLTSGGGGGGIYGFGIAAVIKDSTFSSNSSAKNAGGALFFTSASNVTIMNTSFTGNSATTAGGAISSASTVAFFVTGSTFTSNTAVTSGGAISSVTSTLTSNNFTTNTATTSGGAVATSGTSSLTLNAFTNNSAGTIGGALSSTSASTTVSFSQFTTNTAAGTGGAWNSIGGQLLNSTMMGNTATGKGGAINMTGAMTITHGTLHGNTSSDAAGGGTVMTNTSNLTLTSSTLVGNSATAGPGGGISRTTAGTLLINNTIIAGNTATAGVDLNATTAVTITAGTSTNNWIGQGANAGNVSFGTAPVGTGDASVNAPVNNGGPLLGDNTRMKTSSLKAGSGAIGLGSSTLTTDARGTGFARQVGAAVDVGAYEGVAGIPYARLVLGDVTASGSASFKFDVAYTDTDGTMTDATFDATDVLVTGPNGYSVTAGFDQKVGSAGAWTVTYTAAAPTGNWGGVNTGNNLFNIGVYTVAINSSDATPVTDDAANVVTSPTGTNGGIGTFKTDFGLNIVVSATGDNTATTYATQNHSAGNLIFRAAFNAAAENQKYAPGKVSTITFDTATLGANPSISLASGTGATISVGSTSTGSLNGVGIVVTNPGGGRATINGGNKANSLVVANGQVLTISNVNFTGFSSGASGGAIQMNTATVSLSNSNLTSNTVGATGGAAISMLGSAGVLGGGTTFGRYIGGSVLNLSNDSFSLNTATTGAGNIHVAGTYATISVDSTTFGSSTGTVTGGIRSSATTLVGNVLTINRSTFTGNSSTGTSGAIYWAGSMSITNSLFTNNTAANNGGAIRLVGTGALSINQSMFTGNVSNNSTGALGGGAIYGAGTTQSVLITNSTFNNNFAKSGTGTGGSGGADLLQWYSPE